MIRLPFSMRQAFPVTVLLCFPHHVTDSRLAPYPGFPFCASVAVCRTGNQKGLPGSLTHLFLHATALGLRRTFPSKPLRMVLCCLRHVLKPSTSAPVPYRSCTSTSGCTDTPMACKIPCVRFTCLVRSFLLLKLRHRCNTRYGWVAGPYPAGTFTPQDEPDLSRRENTESNEAGKVFEEEWIYRSALIGLGVR